MKELKKNKITVITITYNSASTIAQTIESVIEQNYDNIEYIFIDGKSNDETLYVIDQYKEYLDKKSIEYKIVSETDQGVYDAMNKGIRLSSGDIICILNSDDIFYDKNVLSSIAKEYADNDTYIVYGDLIYINNDNNVSRRWISRDFKDGLFKRSWAPPHPSFSCRKSVYTDYGLYDDNMTISADVDFMFRVMQINNVKSKYINRYLVKMKQGGLSNSSIRNRLKSFRENIQMFKKYNYRVNYLSYFFNKFMKITQYLNK